MFRVCVVEFQGSWVLYLALVEFAYNNSYHNNIGMTPYEALHRKRCWTSLYWDKMGERILENIELIEATSEKIKDI